VLLRSLAVLSFPSFPEAGGSSAHSQRKPRAAEMPAIQFNWRLFIGPSWGAGESIPLSSLGQRNTQGALYGVRPAKTGFAPGNSLSTALICNWRCSRLIRVANHIPITFALSRKRTDKSDDFRNTADSLRPSKRAAFSRKTPLAGDTSDLHHFPKMQECGIHRPSKFEQVQS
jgi:hypothetical protein